AADQGLPRPCLFRRQHHRPGAGTVRGSVATVWAENGPYPPTPSRAAPGLELPIGVRSTAHRRRLAVAGAQSQRPGDISSPGHRRRPDGPHRACDLDGRGAAVGSFGVL
ncbi:DOPA 4,5-dioxygenase (EC 1.14.99.-), partial [Pseudomonas sp. FG-3G]